MVKNLQGAQSANPSPKAKERARNIASSFEKNMNNDLDVKASFNELYTTVSKLHGLMKKGRLSAEHASAAVNGLRKVDCVLQVLF